MGLKSPCLSSEVDDILWLEHFVELGEDDIGGDGWTSIVIGFHEQLVQFCPSLFFCNHSWDAPF